MATYRAIAAVGQAILGLLSDACPQPEFAGARFELYQVSNLQSPMDEGVSLFLYRITVNTSRRNLGPRVDLNGIRYRPPFPVDLHYMLTAWGRTAAKQQRLLGWAIRTMENTPILPAGLLNHFGPEPDTFRPNETVELIADQIPLQDMGIIWGEAKPNQQPSMIYLARMVLLDSDIPLDDFANVQTRDFGYAKVSE